MTATHLVIFIVGVSVVCAGVLLAASTKRDGPAAAPPITASSPVVTSAPVCGEAVSGLVLDDLYPKLYHHSSLDVWISHNYTEAHWKPILDGQQAKIDGIRSWADALPDACFRRQYHRWLDYYEKGIKEAWLELREQKTRISQAAYKTRLQVDDDAKRKYKAVHPVPKSVYVMPQSATYCGPPATTRRI